VKRQRASRAKKRRESDAAGEGHGPVKTQGDVRASSSGRRCSRARDDRGTGAVMATGSYEGSLPMEGIPDLTNRSLSRANGHGGLGGSFETSNVWRRLHGGREGEATGMSEARSHEGTVGRNAHAHIGKSDARH